MYFPNFKFPLYLNKTPNRLSLYWDFIIIYGASNAACWTAVTVIFFSRKSITNSSVFLLKFVLSRFSGTFIIIFIFISAFPFMIIPVVLIFPTLIYLKNLLTFLFFSKTALKLRDLNTLLLHQSSDVVLH